MSESPHIDIFISYSRKDARWLDELMTHLKPLIREERIAAWCDRLPPLTPVLVEMRSLEKGHPLDVLVSMHMVAAGESRFDTEAFRYMLREGRVALLFDGFDELALRVTYERAAEHLETLVAAAEGRAKVLVTSRTSHFLSEAQAKQKLYEKVESVAGKRLVRNEGFDAGQMHRFLTNYYAQRDRLDADRARQSADDRMDLIRDIQDLLGLSANPRMLSFSADLSHEDLLQARDPSGKITSAQLYQQLLDRWLKGEVKRRVVTGGAQVLAEQHLWDAVTSLALRIWQSGQRSVHVDELTDQVAREIRELRTLNMTVAEATHQVGSGSLLVREPDQRFAFVHRSVMEWLVARRAAQQVQSGEVAEVLAAREMSPLMADFFWGLASRELADRWASQTLAAAGTARDDASKANALLVQTRLAPAAGSSRRHAARTPAAVRRRPATGRARPERPGLLRTESAGGQSVQGPADRGPPGRRRSAPRQPEARRVVPRGSERRRLERL